MNVDTSPRALGQLVLVTTVLITIMEPDVSQKHGMWSCGGQYIVLHMTDYESTMLGDLSDYLWISSDRSSACSHPPSSMGVHNAGNVQELIYAELVALARPI